MLGRDYLDINSFYMYAFRLFLCAFRFDESLTDLLPSISFLLLLLVPEPFQH
jgi:hypothetical protein